MKIINNIIKFIIIVLFTLVSPSLTIKE